MAPDATLSKRSQHSQPASDSDPKHESPQSMSAKAMHTEIADTGSLAATDLERAEPGVDDKTNADDPGGSPFLDESGSEDEPVISGNNTTQEKRRAQELIFAH